MWSNENWLDHRRLWMVAKHLQHNGFSRGYFSFLSEVQTQNIPDGGLIDEAEREWKALISASASRCSQTAASKNSQNSAKEAESNVLILGGNCTPVRNTQGHEWWPLKLLISPSYITKVFNWEGIPPAWPHTLLACFFGSSLGDSFTPTPGTGVGSGAQSGKISEREGAWQESENPGASSLRGWWEMKLSLRTSYGAGYDCNPLTSLLALSTFSFFDLAGLWIELIKGLDCRRRLWLRFNSQSWLENSLPADQG